MKPGWILFVPLLAAVATAAWSQSDASQGSDGLQAERLRIESVRQQKTTEFDAQDAACLSKFAVTDCQTKVGVRRREMLSDLKHQEAELNAIERRQKADAQRKRDAEKLDENAQREVPPPAATASAALEERQKVQDEKVLNHQKQATPAQRKAPGTKVPSGLDADAIAKNRAAYLAKQQEAEKRRKERDKRLLDHDKSIPALPVAP